MPTTLLIKYKFMKRLLTTLLILFIALQSCKKNNQSPVKLVGTWTWVATYQDAPLSSTNPLTPLNSGVKKYLYFTIKNWSFNQDSVTVGGGNYGTSVVTNAMGQKVNAIHFYNANVGTDSTTYYSINKDTLTFSLDFNGTIGSGSTLYVRQ